MHVLESVNKVSKQLVIAAGLTAASTTLAEAASQIYAFTAEGCYRTSIQLDRGKGYWFPVGDVDVRGTIDSATGRPSWEDAFNVVGNVTAAFYTEGREHGVTATYGSMKGCDGSWAQYCGTVAATETEGSLPRNFQALISGNMCLPSSSTRSMFNAIVEGATIQSRFPNATVEVQQQQQQVIVQNNVPTTTRRNGGMSQTCTVGNDACVHIDLKFTP